LICAPNGVDPSFRIADNGCGMTERRLDEQLRIDLHRDRSHVAR
jgi:hypothetical protein